MDQSGRRWLLPVLGVMAVLLLGGAVGYFRDPLLSVFSRPEVNVAAPPADPVTVVEKGVIAVDPAAPLMHRLHPETVVRQDLEYPLLNVTGYVMARLSPGTDKAESRWDFAQPEVATAYADWLNATAEVDFLDQQAKKTRNLVKVRVDFLHAEYLRKKKNANVLPEADVLRAENDWMQADHQGKKDIFEAETSHRKAERNRGLLQRQLEQAGVDPEVVRKATDDLVLVVADVPEAKIALVQLGKPCEASFYGVPNKVFTDGKVGRLGPSVNKEKRTLRVTFELTKSGGKLLPGMFGDIGLDTEKRSVLTVPTEAILHAGRADYVLKEESAGRYRVVEVRVDEPRQIRRGGASVSCVPVEPAMEKQLTEGNHVVGAGAILLKPIMVKALAH